MKSSPFTLLELILVVLILGLISSSALLLVDSKDNQIRYDETKRRLKQIRFALVGKDDAISNEPAVISGYLADMGEVPTSIADFTEKPAVASSWAFNNILGFGSGWRGPYINTFDEEFKDGFGFDFKDPDDNDWDGAEANGDINIISFNEDGEKDGIDFARDLELQIPNSSYMTLQVNKFKIKVINETGAAFNDDLQLLILFPDDDLPTNFTTEAWLDLDAKFKSVETQTVNLLTTSPGDQADLDFTISQDLIFRKIRIFIVRPNVAGTSIQDKIVNNPDADADGNPDRFDHLHLYPLDLTTPTFTFRIK